MITVADLSEDEFEFYEERAAIIEYDGGLQREDAERMALDEVISRRQKMLLPNSGKDQL